MLTGVLRFNKSHSRSSFRLSYRGVLFVVHIVERMEKLGLSSNSDIRIKLEDYESET